MDYKLSSIVFDGLTLIVHTEKALGVEMSDASHPLLTPDQLDHIGLALITLAKEVWVLRDRQMVTEAMLQEKGLLSDLDTYQPPPHLVDALKIERQRFMDDVLAPLLDRSGPKA